MVDLQVTTLDCLDAVLDEAKVAEFQAALRGPLIQPGDEGYDEQRQVWNANIDRRPALIARCAGVADVITCVNFARENVLLVSVRGGGHNVAGNAVCDGGIMIDLSQMKSVRVDHDAAPLAPSPASPGGSSTSKPRPSVWQPPEARFPPRVSLGSPLAAVGAGWHVNTGWL